MRRACSIRRTAVQADREQCSSRCGRAALGPPGVVTWPERRRIDVPTPSGCKSPICGKRAIPRLSQDVVKLTRRAVRSNRRVKIMAEGAHAMVLGMWLFLRLSGQACCKRCRNKLVRQCWQWRTSGQFSVSVVSSAPHVLLVGPARSIHASEQPELQTYTDVVRAYILLRVCAPRESARTPSSKT